MRTHWTLSWLLVGTIVGCSGPGIPGAPRFAQKQDQQAAQLAAAQQASGFGPQTQPGFTQRVTAAIMPGDQASAKPQAPPVQSQHDPISLGFASGPPNAELYLSMAKLSDRSGNVDHARSMYYRSLSMDQHNSEALLGLARLEDREGRLDEAVRVYQQAFAAHPQNVAVINDLALCHARKGELEYSLQLLDRATRIAPTKSLYRNNIAKVLTEMNRLDEAALQLATVYPPAVVNYNMAILLNERGRKEEAIKYLTAATQMDPQLEQASVLLSQLTSAAPQYANRAPQPNDHILPTPMTAEQQAQQDYARRYPATGAPAPVAQQVPAETAQAPLGMSPIMLPPIR